MPIKLGKPRRTRMLSNRIAFRMFLTAEIAVGFLVGGWELAHWQCADWRAFVFYLVVSLFSAPLKIRIPNLLATLTPTFITVTLATIQLSLAEAIVISCACSLMQ